MGFGGDSQDHGDPKPQSWTNLGIWVLFDPHHSPRLHPLEPVWWCSQWVKWRCFPGLCRWVTCPMMSKRGLTSREWLSMKPGIMVLIWVPLSKRAMHLSLLTLTLAMSLIPYHWLKGLGFKEGVCVWHFIHWVSHPGALLAASPLFEGLMLPSLVPSPLFSFNLSLF